MEVWSLDQVNRVTTASRKRKEAERGSGRFPACLQRYTVRVGVVKFRRLYKTKNQTSLDYWIKSLERSYSTEHQPERCRADMGQKWRATT